jgi:hypothetical protein
MSYGIWKKRGKNWSSFELDGCDSWRWDKMPEFKQRILQKKAREAGIGGYWGARDMDPSYVIWHLGQLDRGRIVEEVNTRSCHALWISYRNDEAKAAALLANRFVNVEGERIHATA